MEDDDKRRRREAVTQPQMRRVSWPIARTTRRRPQSYVAPRPTAARLDIVAADLRNDDRYEE